MLCCVFFFKQKTAYEMRISDWSSDVCSSDLLTSHRTGFAAAKSSPVFTRPREESVRLMRRWGQGPKLGKWTHHPCHALQLTGRLLRATSVLCRSEEHTSELQSLMRISYAVFCLKKKKKQTKRITKEE